jgi:hypothetical protein
MHGRLSDLAAWGRWSLWREGAGLIWMRPSVAELRKESLPGLQEEEGSRRSGTVCWWCALASPWSVMMWCISMPLICAVYYHMPGNVACLWKLQRTAMFENELAMRSRALSMYIGYSSKFVMRSYEEQIDDWLRFVWLHPFLRYQPWGYWRDMEHGKLLHIWEHACARACVCASVRVWFIMHTYSHKQQGQPCSHTS